MSECIVFDSDLQGWNKDEFFKIFGFSLSKSIKTIDYYSYDSQLSFFQYFPKKKQLPSNPMNQCIGVCLPVEGKHILFHLGMNDFESDVNFLTIRSTKSFSRIHLLDDFFLLQEGDVLPEMEFQTLRLIVIQVL
ncbi:hypothetical protein EDI_195360 [Entamoeba dispar SAW760]|uniref:Uncharacterized protein n=1 Tax=Entamoeba dispar (strain ATCC PRA-260 / SAW760) TaxID=370354 RepID=B0EGR2_ENTDS|nr:uncharacterized protein EDI_195360 [Entamoeba dispar SAW760]EDR26284.1 hypothetical protein EDI_195360 [Entamoeba dispar SAW760]|eukprot:EDR26284.1 hypothetical protein EDI_195360 [Entamoeba dispar SAW760]